MAKYKSPCRHPKCITRSKDRCSTVCRRRLAYIYGLDPTRYPIPVFTDNGVTEVDNVSG